MIDASRSVLERLGIDGGRTGKRVPAELSRRRGTGTLLCGDLFTQLGNNAPALTESSAVVWEPSEAMRKSFPYASLRDPRSLTDKLAATRPELLACMHGASFRGDGASLLNRLGVALHQTS